MTKSFSNAIKTQTVLKQAHLWAGLAALNSFMGSFCNDFKHLTIVFQFLNIFLILFTGYFTLFGITSWGQHCGYANKPGVYVKIGHYRKWIDETILKSLK